MYEVDEFMQVKPKKGSGKTKKPTKAQIKKDLKKAEALLMGSGIDGGFLEFLLAPIKMIQNGIEHKPAFQGLGTKNMGGFGLNDIIFPFKMIDNAVNKRRWDSGIFGNGKKQTKAKKPRKVNKKMSERGRMISKLMKSQGMTLGEASSALKQMGY